MLLVYCAAIKLNLQKDPLFCFVKGWLYLGFLEHSKVEILGWSLQLCVLSLSFNSHKAHFKTTDACHLGRAINVLLHDIS